MGYSGDEILDLLMISKYYERIGDHATNIGEWAEFSVDGIHRNGDSISDLFNPNRCKKTPPVAKSISWQELFFILKLVIFMSFKEILCFLYHYAA